jgi:hypothetical protein
MFLQNVKVAILNQFAEQHIVLQVIN